MVLARAAVRARRLRARHGALHGYAVARLEPCDLLADLHDYSCTLVSKSIFTSDDHGADPAVFPEMYIGAADSCRADVYETLVGSDGWDGAFDEVEVVGGVRLDGEVLGLAGEDVCHFCVFFFFALLGV